MNNRIKQLRRTLDLTQQEFAERIGSVQNTITGYESGRRNPSNAVVTSICREFNVNEDWLRYGNGSMFKENETFSLDDFARCHGATDLELEIMKSYFELDVDTRLAIMSLFTGRISKKTIYDDVPGTPEELEQKYKPIDEDINNVG